VQALQLLDECDRRLRPPRVSYAGLVRRRRRLHERRGCHRVEVAVLADPIARALAHALDALPVPRTRRRVAALASGMRICRRQNARSWRRGGCELWNGEEEQQQRRQHADGRGLKGRRRHERITKLKRSAC
jgi:hypothetical protein